MGPHFGNFTGPTTGPGVGSATGGPGAVAATEATAGAPGSDQTLHVPGGGVIENAADDTDNYGRGYGAGGYGAGASEMRRAEQAMGVGTGYYHGVGDPQATRAGFGTAEGPGAIPGAGYGSGTGAGLGTAAGAARATGAAGATTDSAAGPCLVYVIISAKTSDLLEYYRLSLWVEQWDGKHGQLIVN